MINHTLPLFALQPENNPVPLSQGASASANAIRPAANVARLVAVPFANARAAIGELTPGVRVVGLTKGQFSLLDLICAVLEQVGPAEVMVSTWTPGKADMNSVADMLDSRRITRFRLLVDRSFVTRHPEYVARIHAAFGAETIRQTRTHAKFALIAAGDWRIAIRTSMNFNRNPRFEQFDLDDDAAIYDFFDEAVEELYETLPAGLNVPSPVVVRHFAGVTMGALFRMEEEKDVEMLDELLSGVNTGEDALQALLADMAVDASLLAEIAPIKETP